MRESWHGKFIRGLHRSVCLIDKLADRVLAKHKEVKVSFSQFQIMLALEHEPHASQQAVAHFLDITEAAVSRHIHLLSKEGFVTSVSVLGNRRKNALMLTVKGKAEFEACMRVLSNYFKDIFKEVKERYNQTALKTLDCALLHLEKADQLINKRPVTK